MPRADEGALNILIVDDIPQTRQLLRALLRSIGYPRVTEAENVAEAYSSIKRRRPDLVLTDWEMPGGAGVELVRAVRTRPDSPDPLLPIIMITAHGNIDYVIGGRDAGTTQFLVKPFAPARLRERILDVAQNDQPFVISPGYKGPCRRRIDKSVPLERRAPADALPPGVTLLPPDGLLYAKITGDPVALAEAVAKRSESLRIAIAANQGSASPAPTADATLPMSSSPLFAGVARKALLEDPLLGGLEALVDNALVAAENYNTALARMAGPLALLLADQGPTLPPAALKLIASLQRILADPTGARADPKVVELHLQALRAMLRSELDRTGEVIAHELATEIDALARATSV